MTDQRPHNRDGGNRHERLLEDIERLGRRVRGLEQRLKESDRMATLGHACAAVAHEFNNLLTPALGYARLALEAPDDAELSRKALEKAAASIDKASAITTSLLGVARGDEPAGGTCDVGASLDEAISCLGRPLSRDGISLERAVEPGLRAEMAPIALEQVFLNLLLNARAALSKGQTVQVSAERSTWNAISEGEPCVRIQVSDTGPGLPSGIASAVFASEADGGATGGLKACDLGEEGRPGLGLSICRRLVEGAGGSIRLDSQAGYSGACFTILLPAADSGRAKLAA